MIYSMTAFGRSQAKGDWGSAVWELRTINHRYLEMNIRLPEILRELESPVRDIINKSLQRGKIECNLKFQPGPKLGSFVSINQSLLNQLLSILIEVNQLLPEKITRINVIDLLAWQGVIIEENFDVSTLRENLLKLFEEALLDLKAAREREGKLLEALIVDRLNQIHVQANTIKSVFPKILERQREKILQRLEDAKVMMDQQRFEQEIVYLAQKIDISEELDRLNSHITEVKHTLNKKDSIGRRLDFMMQECNREANTLASKSMDAVVTHAAVEMKVLIEQIREQVQNIE